MSKSGDTPRFIHHRIGVAGLARSRVCRGTGAPSRGATALMFLVMVVAVMAFSSASALAVKIYVPGVSFGSEGSGPDQFKEPVGVAVNEASPLVEPVSGGDVYVVDKGNDRVERFGASGEYKGQFDGSGEYEVEGKKVTGAAAPTGVFSSPEQVAVNSDESSPSFGEVYVLDVGHEVIDEFSSIGEYKGQLTAADTCNPTICKFKEELGAGAVRSEKLTTVTVDPSGNIWTDDDIREELPNKGVNKNGISVQEEIYVSECSDTGTCTIKFQDLRAHIVGMALDTSGNVDVLSEGSIQKLGPSGEIKGEIAEQSYNRALFPLAFAIDPLASDTFFDEGDEVARFGPIAEGTVGSGQSPVETFASGDLSESHGIAVNSASADGTVYASEGGADRVETFNYLPLPSVATQAPSGVSETALMLHGTVDPEGEPVSECYFEYGSEAGVYTNKVPCSPAPPFSGTAPAVPVSAASPGFRRPACAASVSSPPTPTVSHARRAPRSAVLCRAANPSQMSV